MLMDYLGQVATHLKKIGTNTYNEPLFEAKEIACRKIDRTRKVTNEKGELVISGAIVQCVDLVKIGDLIDGRKVIAVDPMSNLDGIVGYRVFLL